MRDCPQAIFIVRDMATGEPESIAVSDHLNPNGSAIKLAPGMGALLAEALAPEPARPPNLDGLPAGQPYEVVLDELNRERAARLAKERAPSALAQYPKQPRRSRLAQALARLASLLRRGPLRSHAADRDAR